MRVSAFLALSRIDMNMKHGRVGPPAYAVRLAARIDCMIPGRQKQSVAEGSVPAQRLRVREEIHGTHFSPG
jgi:hypothetical protein